jgi:hypothetical protein
MKEERMRKIEIYTDGACSGNPGPGGWGAVLFYRDQKKELSGGWIDEAYWIHLLFPARGQSGYDYFDPDPGRGRATAPGSSNQCRQQILGRKNYSPANI